MCDEILNELCPIMSAQDARIRGRSQCFDIDQEVCTVVPMLYTPIINLTLVLKQQLNKQIIPNPILQVVLPTNLLLNNKPEDMRQPIIAPLVKQPLIIAPSIAATTTSTSTTTTTTISPITSTTASTTTTPHFENLPSMSDNNDKEIKEKLAENDLNIQENLVNSTTPHHVEVAVNVTSLPPLLESIIIGKVTEAQPDLPADVMENIEYKEPQTETVQSTNINDTFGKIEPQVLTQTEYATVKYLEDRNELNASQDKSSLTDVLDEDSNSNSVHEEFPSVVLADFDNAPQSLLIPEEPPENP